MMFKTFDTFFTKFEHITKRERATHETPAQVIRKYATVAGVPVAVWLINLELFEKIIYFHNNLFLGVRLKYHIEIVGFGIGADGEVTLRCRNRNMAEPTGNVLNSFAVVHENGGKGVAQNMGVAPFFGDYLA